MFNCEISLRACEVFRWDKSNKKPRGVLASGLACFDRIENRPSRPPVCANNHDADDVGGSDGQINQRSRHEWPRTNRIKIDDRTSLAGRGGVVKLSRANPAFNAWRIIIFNPVPFDGARRNRAHSLRRFDELCAIMRQSLRNANASLQLRSRFR